MPWKTVICEVDRAECSKDECRACSIAHTLRRDPSGKVRHCRFNAPMIHALLREQTERKHAGISATMLTGPCPRQAVWNQRYDYAQRPGQSWAALHGTFVHEGLEKFTPEEYISEVRIAWITPSGTRITGQFDLLLPELLMIHDYKTKADGRLFTRPPAGYEAQLNIYARMLRAGATVVRDCYSVGGKLIAAAGEKWEPIVVTSLWLYPVAHSGPGEPVECPIWPDGRVDAYIEAHLQAFLLAEMDPDYIPARGFADPRASNFCTGFCPHVERCVAAGGPVIESEH